MTYFGVKIIGARQLSTFRRLAHNYATIDNANQLCKCNEKVRDERGSSLCTNSARHAVIQCILIPLENAHAPFATRRKKATVPCSSWNNIDLATVVVRRVEKRKQQRNFPLLDRSLRLTIYILGEKMVNWAI